MFICDCSVLYRTTCGSAKSSETATRLTFFLFYFAEKYEYVGKLLRPGEQPTDYELEEDEGIGADSTSAPGAAGDSKKSN